MADFEPGSDIPFNQKYRISEGNYVNITTLAKYEIWLYVVESDIKKYSRTGSEAGYNQLRKVSDQEYEAKLLDTMTSTMKCGEIKMKIVWGETNSNYPDGIYNDIITINTGAYLRKK